MWDWQINNSYESFQMRNALRLEFKLKLDEDKIKELIKDRKSFEKTKLLIRRISTLSLTIVILLLGWALILIVNIYESNIQDYFKKNYILQYIASFVATICLSLINVAVPNIIKFITELEAWDF